MGHLLKGYADDVTLISDDFNTYISVLQFIDLKVSDLDVSLNQLSVCPFLWC